MPVACYEHGDQFERLNNHQWNSQHQERRIGTELLKPPAKVFYKLHTPHAVQVSASTPKGAGVLAMTDSPRSRRRPEALSCSKMPFPALKPPPCVTSMSQAAAAARPFSPRGSTHDISISALNLTASLTEAARLAKKAQICLLIVENVQEHRHSDLQAMKTFRPRRP